MTRPPEVPALRLFDIGMGKIVGEVVEENADGVILSWPALLNIKVEPKVVDGKPTSTLVYKARFEPIAFVGDRYLLYRNAIRGECYTYSPSLVEAYQRYNAIASLGRFELTEATPLESTREEAPEVPVDAPAPTSHGD